MDIRILAIGDVVGESGLMHLQRYLRTIQKHQGIHLTVVNGENAAGVGLTEHMAEDMFRAGAQVVTLGNHAWGKPRLAEWMEQEPCLLRPANYTQQAPGQGSVICTVQGLRVKVVNLIGRCGLDFHADNPFFTMDRLLQNKDADLTVVDFHAEATSEKLAMAYYLDGRVAALWGTHTHVPTADEQIFPKGMGYLTDLGMTGPVCSVLGIRPEQSVQTFLGGLSGRYQTAEGPCKMQGAVFSIDVQSGCCTAVERIDIR